MNNPLQIPKNGKSQLLWVWALIGSLVGSLMISAATNEPLVLGLPVVILIFYLSVVDFRAIFFLLLLCVPLSTEFSFPNGLGTDLPSEPLMVGLTGIFILYTIRNPNSIKAAIITHPISIALWLHISWIAFTALYSDNPIVSIKFLLAKIWYVVPFYILFFHLLRDRDFLKNCFWYLFLPMFLTVLYVLFRHSLWGFAFDKVNSVTDPFYRNHVNYACIQSIFFPFIVYAWTKSRKNSLLYLLLILGIVTFLLGIWFSYTRAAYVVLIFPLFTFLLLKFNLSKVAVFIGLATLIVGSIYFLSNNKYLEFAPDYEKTITHKDFGNLLSATTKGEDISTMERFYRWVAGVYMLKAEPVVGFGPGNFYNYYKSYTVKSFRTYVSDNPEKSGIHNYFLMTAVDQGIPGLVIFLTLCSIGLITGQRAYNNTIGSENQALVLLAVSTILVILALLFINDLLEVDKIGPFFFMSLATLVKLDSSTIRQSIRSIND